MLCLSSNDFQTTVIANFTADLAVGIALTGSVLIWVSYNCRLRLQVIPCMHGYIYEQIAVL